MNSLGILLVVLTGIIGFEIGYWRGKDVGSRDAWRWRRRHDEAHRKYVLLEQKANGLQHELEFFYPKTVWNNARTDPDQSR